MNHAFDTRRSWSVYLLAVVVYISAIWQRSSFGVAGVVATERFHVLASVLSLFVVVQLLTYAAMQVPAGLLADRFGSRVVIGSGAAIMALGQLSLANSTSLVPAVAARVLIGMGDAMTFTSVIRLLPFWFSARRVPMLVQLTSMFGQVGQLISTIPFAAFLRQRGWTPAFTLLAVVSLVAAATSWSLLRNRPDGQRVHSHVDGDFSFIDTARQVWRNPATKLGFLLHAVAGFPGLVFAMMWGYPYLDRGVGLGAGETSLLFALLVVTGMVCGPLIGWLAPRHPLRLSNFSLTVAAANVVALGVVLSFERPPLWALVLWMVALSANAAGSNIGIEVARTRNLASRIGTATGVVIMGAFVFGVAGMLLFGVVLDLAGGYTPAAFRVAWSTQLVLFAIGFVGVYALRPKVRRLNAAEGRVVPPWPDALAREWRRWRERLSRR
ncbi:MFS transporter [Aestuariimicrobium kwangyangense]|uniref:MFS transporter n=1 Tax=Aestuariimicrobium kwangyangense TaxID=396389 RepID=UPI00058D2667|nr:MFS transporter [Aestuariimicrobium kwangyangense]